MAQKQDSGIGRHVGGLVALIMVAGLGATPIYLSALRSPNSTIDEAIQPDVEYVRYALLNLDESLAALGDVAQMRNEDGEVAPQLRAVLRTQEEWITKADAAMTRLAAVRVGDQGTQNHLDVNRAKAQLNLAKARLKLNRAALHDSASLDARREAEHAATLLVEMQQRRKTIDLQQPTEALANVGERTADAEARIAALQTAVDRLKGAVAGKESQLASLHEATADARRELLTLEMKQGSTVDYRARYEELSDLARQAEADSAALENGTLRDARLSPEADDLLTAVYEGGRAELGLRDLRFGQELLEEQLANSKRIRENLAREESAITDQLAALKKDGDESREQVAAQVELVEEALESAATFSAKARELDEAAGKDLQAASLAAKSAITAAKNAVNDARQALSALEGAADSRLEMLSKDLETQAAAQCLAADIAYYQGLTRARGLRATRDLFQVQASIAKTLGKTAPASIEDDLKPLIEEALARLDEAAKTYEEAGKLLERSTIRTSEGTINGKNSVWQIEVAGAAVHLLEAQLAPDPSASAAKKDLAYQLLVEAVKGREQSPLLAPAMATLIYLQQTAE